MTLCDSTQYVHYLSPTESGRQHDKKLADEYQLHLPAGSVLRQDLGLLGHAPAGVLVERPHKKSPKRELTFSQQLTSSSQPCTRQGMSSATPIEAVVVSTTSRYTAASP